MKRLGVVAIAIMVVLVGCGESGDKVQITVFAEVNQSIINTLRLGGADCDMSGYDIDILDTDGRSVATENLGKGSIDDAGIFCGFTVRMDVPAMDEYRVFIGVHSGDTRIVAKTIPHEDAVQADGTLDVAVRWYNHRDAD